MIPTNQHNGLPDPNHFLEAILLQVLPLVKLGDRTTPHLYRHLPVPRQAPHQRNRRRRMAHHQQPARAFNGQSLFEGRPKGADEDVDAVVELSYGLALSGGVEEGLPAWIDFGEERL